MTSDLTALRLLAQRRIFPVWRCYRPRISITVQCVISPSESVTRHWRCHKTWSASGLFLFAVFWQEHSLRCWTTLSWQEPIPCSHTGAFLDLHASVQQLNLGQWACFLFSEFHSSHFEDKVFCHLEAWWAPPHPSRAPEKFMLTGNFRTLMDICREVLTICRLQHYLAAIEMFRDTTETVSEYVKCAYFSGTLWSRTWYHLYLSPPTLNVAKCTIRLILRDDM